MRVTLKDWLPHSANDVLVKVNDECIFGFAWLAVDRKSMLLSIALLEAMGSEGKSARLRKQRRWKLVRTGGTAFAWGEIRGRRRVVVQGRHVGGRDESALQRASSYWRLMRFMHETDCFFFNGVCPAQAIT